MGQMCSLCPSLCCCCARKAQIKKRKKVPGESWKQVDDLTPSEISDSELAAQYTIPGDKFRDIQEVFELRGYDFANKEQIGQGGFATVYKMNQIKNKTVALKQIPLKGYETKRDPKLLENLKSEVFVISKIKHKNIVQLFDQFIINNVSFLVMEFANSGTVQDEIQKLGPMDEKKAKTYFIQISKAIAYLHNRSPSIAHRDLKLANILIHIENKEKILKITDFGFSRVLNEKTDKKIFRAKVAEGTPAYMSPQLLKIVLKEKEVNPQKRKRMYEELDIQTFRSVNPIKADIWALGVCLFFMVSKKYPYDLNKELLNVIIQMEDRRIEPITKKISTQLDDLLERMLDPMTDSRIDINGIVEHKWLYGVSDVIKIKNR